MSDVDAQHIAAVLRLEDRRQLDLDTLGALAHDATPEVRRRVLLAAGRIGDPAARPLVLQGLDDRLPTVRAAAAFAAGMLRDSATVEALAAMALTDSAAPAGEAVFALGRIRGEAARAATLAVLRAAGAQPGTADPPGRDASAGGGGAGGVPPAAVAGRALLTIWRFPRLPDATAAVRRYTTVADTALRWRAAYALMRLGDPAAVPDLRRLLGDPQTEVRANAARGLRATVADSAGQHAEALQALTAALADPQPHVRIMAATALAGYRDAPVPRLAALLRDTDPNVVIAAAGALGTLGNPAAADPLQTLERTAAAPLPLRAAALAALLRVQPAAGLAAAAAWQHAAAWRERWYAADALAGAPAAAAALEALAHDDDARVAAAALTGLAQTLADSLPASYPLLVEALSRPDPIVRAAALGLLAARADTTDLSLVLDAYDRARTDAQDDAAVAAVELLGRLQRAGAPAARDFFARFGRSPDYIVRRHVAAALGESWGGAEPVETNRDRAFYLGVVRRLVGPGLSGAPSPRVRIRTAAGVPPVTGEIVVALTAAETPLTADNFLTLARRGYFDGGRWHRVVPDFVAQDGDPRGDGNGGPGWAIRDELTAMPYLRGALGMALSGPDTGGSQFFLTVSPQPHLDAGYTLFGQVVGGMDVLDRVLQDDRILRVDVLP